MSHRPSSKSVYRELLDNNDLDQFQIIPRNLKNHLHWISPSELATLLPVIGHRMNPHQLGILIQLNQQLRLYDIPDRHLMQMLGMGEHEYMGLCMEILKLWEVRLEDMKHISFRPSLELEEKLYHKEMLKRQGIYAADRKHLHEAYQQQVAERKRSSGQR